MKKFSVCILIIILLFLGVGGYFFIRNRIETGNINEIKNGWYVEITYDEPIKVRDQAGTKGKVIGEVKKGEVYKALEVNTESNVYFWYKIEYKGKTGWIASNRKNHWVNDVNNPEDIATPIIRFKSNTYKVKSIDDINYKHLEIIEDSTDYTITHQIYHEVNPSEFINQYWILYTVTDKAGKSSSKMQKIEFAEKPAEAEVLDFSLYKR